MKATVLLLVLAAGIVPAQYVEIGEGGTMMIAMPFCGA